MNEGLKAVIAFVAPFLLTGIIFYPIWPKETGRTGRKLWLSALAIATLAILFVIGMAIIEPEFMAEANRHPSMR